MFAFIVDDYLAIDLACGFGWCGSPAMYFLPGALTNGQNEDSSNSSAVVSHHHLSIPSGVTITPASR
ncbi:hypothetical protein GQ600_7533 [Phytophthora cactorum]|nr:hypothetical protein GQ600_12851 [Phytophthora cactorum]KAF1785712.1 hypothetical protein GQ600_7533 [Phytophthora cactorum]